MTSKPFKMKGSPFQRNFGVGEAESPVKDDPHTTIPGHPEHTEKVSKVKSDEDKDITNRGGFNDEITAGIEAGTTKVYQKPDGTVYTASATKK